MDHRALLLVLVGALAGGGLVFVLQGKPEAYVAAPVTRTPPPAPPSEALEEPRLTGTGAAQDPAVLERVWTSLRRVEASLARHEAVLERLAAEGMPSGNVPPEAGTSQDTDALLALREELPARGVEVQSPYFCWSRPQILRAFGPPDLVETPYSGAVTWTYFPEPGEKGVQFTFQYGLVSRVGLAWHRAPREGR